MTNKEKRIVELKQQLAEKDKHILEYKDFKRIRERIKKQSIGEK